MNPVLVLLFTLTPATLVAVIVGLVYLARHREVIKHHNLDTPETGYRSRG